MSSEEPAPDDVIRAAEAIVGAFAANDGDRYFACFAPDATFCFYAEPARLDDRASYERLWSEWIADGWRVRACTSSQQLVQTFQGGAVFTHDVATTVSTSDGEDSTRERETIVFRADGDRLVAIHEHLSPAAG
ncbi:MAG TPA: nuclear transport factor 2 family protein [Mycobacterium sp.]|nr:nuclear transport factor 2 family protein [Mycobacterium sp.]